MANMMGILFVLVVLVVDSIVQAADAQPASRAIEYEATYSLSIGEVVDLVAQPDCPMPRSISIKPTKS